MSKITLLDTAGGYNLQNINSNFQRIEEALNEEVLYRDNPVGEPNQMDSTLDMNSHRIINLPEPLAPSEAARLQDVQNAIGEQATANLTTFTPTDDIEATNVQAAIVEVNRYTQTGTGARSRLKDEKLRELASVFEFTGVVGDGVNDDTAGLQAALNSGHKLVRFPRPSVRYNISGSLTVPDQVHVVGDSRWTTNIQSTDVDAPIFILNNVANCQIENIHLSYSGVPISGANAISVLNSQTCSFLRLWISSSWNGIFMDGGGNHSVIDYRCYSYENTALLVSSTVDVNMSVFRFHAGDSIKGRLGGIRLQGPVEAFTASQGDVTLGVFGMTTANFGSNARGQAPYFNRFNQVYFDSPLNEAAFLDSLCHTDFVSCWFASAGHDEAVGFGSALEVPGISMNNCLHLNFSGGDVFNNGGAGAIWTSTSRNINFGGKIRFKRNQFSRAVDGAALVIGANTTDFTISDAVFERDTDTVTFRQAVSINVTPGTSNRYNITNNITGGCIILDSGTGTNKVIQGNLGAATASSGAAAITVGNTFVVVNHNLAFTPGFNEIMVTPVVNPLNSGITHFWVSNVGATTFQVNTNAAVAVSDFLFGWSARTKNA